MILRRLTLPWALGLGLILVPALTNDASAQSNEELAEARATFQRAVELEHAENWSGALRLYRKVGQVRMTPQVRYHIALCEEQLGKLVAALGGYELALADADGMSQDFLDEVRSSIDELNTRIPRLVIERGQGADAAAIELDGISLGSRSIGVEVPLDPGPHALSASAPGYERFETTVTLSEGSTETISIELERLESGATSAALTADDGGGAASDGGQYGVYPYLLGGVGIVSLATSGVFFALNRSNVSKLEEQCGGTTCELPSGPWQEANDRYDTAQTQELVAWVTLGFGVASLGAGATLYFLERDPTEELVRLPGGGSVGVRASAPAAESGVSLVGVF